MPALTKSNPKYRKHRASGQAIVAISGRDIYLGPHGTKASRAEYDRLIALWLAGGRTLPTPASDLTIVEMLARWGRFAVGHYRKNGRPTRALDNIGDAIRPLKMLYGHEPVADFGPLKLQTVRQLMVTGFRDSRGKAFKGLARRTVNQRIGAIKLIIRWAVSQEIAPPSLWHALDTVRGLQKGRTEARETAPVCPVDDATVTATLPHMPDLVADMVKFQRLTGCRPGEVCLLRPCDVDRSGEVWKYTPEGHKTEHRGRDRVVFIGPKAQEILTPYLLRDKSQRCFRPIDSERKRREVQHEARKTPLSCGNRPGTNRFRRPKRTPGSSYDKNAYARAITRACDLADAAARKANPDISLDVRIVPRWSPNRLRHAAATEIRSKFGLEAAQVALGHSRADVTQVYAERNASLGAQVAKAIG